MATCRFNPDARQTFTASGAIEPFTLVKLTSTADTVIVCGAGDDPIGIAESGIATGAQGVIYLRSMSGSFPLKVSGAVTVGALVYCGASGKGTATVSGSVVGRAKTSASADGDVIEVIPLDTDGNSVRFARSKIAASTQVAAAATTAQAFDTTHSIPANTLRAGDRVKVRGVINFTGKNSTNTMQARALWGTTAVVDTGATQAFAATGVGSLLTIEYEATVRSIGASGSVVFFGTANSGASMVVDLALGSATAVTPDTTGAITLSFDVAFSGASASNTAKLEVHSLEIISGA